MILLLLIPFLLFAKPPAEYELLRKFLKTRDIYTGLFLIDRFRNAVFVDELKVEVATELLKRGYKEKALKVARGINLDNVREFYADKVQHLWTSLELDPKPFLLRFPERATELIGRVKFTKEEKRKVLRRLLSKGLYGEVLKNSVDLCLYRVLALYRLGRFEETVREAKGCKDRGSWRYGLLALLKRGDLEGARRFASEKEDPDLYFLLGWELLQRGDLEGARKYIERSGENFRRFFYSALIRYMEGRYRLAYEELSEGEKFAKGSFERAKVFFWKFKVLKAIGDEVMAYYYLAKASEEEGFYGAVARRMLGEKVHRPVRLRVSSTGTTLVLSRLLGIAEAGFPYYMRLEALKLGGQLPPQDLILLSRIDPYSAIRIAALRFGVGSEVFRAVSFPTPYRELVRRASERFGIDEALIYAVMRQESLFDRFAVSRSNAKGLMQLLDRTAKWMGERIGLDPKDLFDPETNVTLGVAYLKYLDELWGGDLLRVLASYNAGPGAVKRWKRYGDDFLFIELIPYAETRKYVKRVLWYYYVYREILSE